MAAGSLKPNVNNFISQNSAKGSFTRLISSTGGSGTKTAASTTSGYIHGMRYPDPLVLPGSFGAGVTGCIPTQIILQQGGGTGGGVMVAGLEVNLGSIDLSTGTFTDGSAMPSRSLAGAASSTQTAASMIMMVIRTTLTATTPTITVTYKNQAGTSSRSAALTLPTNAVALSAFAMMPHLQGTDTGVQDITAVTKSAGTVGIIDFYGVIPMSTAGSIGLQQGNVPVLSTPLPLLSLQTSDTVAMYVFSDTAILGSSSGLMLFSGIADN